MNKRIIWLITILLSMSVVCLIVLQTFWIKNAITIKKHQFQDLVYRSLNDASKELQSLEVLDHSLENTIVDSIYFALNSVSDGTDPLINNLLAKIDKMRLIGSSLSLDDMNRLIQKHLKNRGIELDYQWAILDELRNVKLKSAIYTQNTDAQQYTIQLMSHDIMKQPDMLTLYFPNQRDYLLESMGFMASSTLFLTFVIILCFTATSYIIFRQKKLSEIKSDFISNMTHELKTPISTISLASQMLGDTSIDPDQKNTKNLTDLITKETKKLGFQVERVLQMATFDEKRLDFKLEPLELLHLLQNAMKEIRLQVESKKGRLSFQNNANSTLVNVDSLHITSVLSNLMDNALKYSTENILIEVELYNEDDWVCCSFKDHGIGIAKENLKRVFEKFYRVPSGNVHNVKGFGLGLSYVKNVVEGHDGHVQVESEINQGSVFTIKLPLIKS